MNGACGFIAIVFASRGPAISWNLFFMRRAVATSFTVAGFMVFLAMVADVLDGRVARLTRTTSSFGGQLDSLSDAISFGVAPAFIMIKLAELHLQNLRLAPSFFTVFLGRGIIFAAIIYAMCAVVRLARFNVENEEDESAHMSFSGLPSPAAAGVVVSLVVFHQQLLPRFAGSAAESFRIFEIITACALPVITLLTGILMVTRIRYPHAANRLLRSKKTLASLLLIFASAILIVWNIQLAMVVGFCGFALVGFIRWLFVSLFRKGAGASKKAPPQENPEQPQPPVGQ